MRLGLTTAAFYGRLETEDAAQKLRQFDVDCAEVFLETYSEYSALFGALVRERLGGIPATSVHPLGTVFENSLFGRSARQRMDAQRIFENVLEAMQALGAKVYVYHGRHSSKGTPLPPDFESYAPRIRELCDLAAAYGVRLCWENVWWCQLSTPQRVVQVREACPRVGFVLDVKQAMRAGFDAADFALAMSDRLCNVHVCDYDAQGKLCMPGKGVCDFSHLGDALRAAGYEGPVILEPYATLFKTDEEIVQSLSYLRKKLKIASQADKNRV